MEWLPSFGSVDNRQPFFDPHMGRKYSSFREMERDARSHGKMVVTNKDFEQNLGKTDDVAGKLNRDDKRLDAAIEKSFYRLQHGYKD